MGVLEVRTGPPTAPRIMASAPFAAVSASSVKGLLCASIEHWEYVRQRRARHTLRGTYSSEKVLLEVECVVRVLLDHFEDFDCFRNDLKFVSLLSQESARAAVTSGPTPSPG